jgi:iron complex transport system substrate-binding protein
MAARIVRKIHPESRGRALLALMAGAIALTASPQQDGAYRRLHAAEQVTVVDDTGQRVTLAAPAQRIVAFAPDLTELLFTAGAGARVVGASEFSDQPPEARHLPRIGNAARVDLEQVVALAPDLAIVWHGVTQAGPIAALAARGVAIYRSQIGELEGITTTLIRLGTLAGTETVARQHAEQLRDRLYALRQRFAHRVQIPVFYQIWDRPLMSVHGKHLIHNLLVACGGINLIADTSTRVPVVDRESVLAADPAVILASGYGDERPAWLDLWRRWPWLSAVRQERLFAIAPDPLQRATPRTLPVMETVCQLLQGDTRTARPPGP